MSYAAIRSALLSGLLISGFALSVLAQEEMPTQEHFFMAEDRTQPLDLPLKAALNCVSRLGVGSKEMPRGKL